LTIAKLELNAALLGARLANTVGEALREKVTRRTFWTDSSAVRGWLRATASFYKPFVSHRVGEIQTLVLPQEWRYVPGEQNPADYATRSQLQDQAIVQDWIDGPRFLCQVENMWPKDLNVPKNLDEIKKDFQNFQVSSERYGR
jgi:Pao retrotransposon peptidase.